jgi:peptidoglycan/xylan/chitin deacetylase (PgdA/CDA1 family)
MAPATFQQRMGWLAASGYPVLPLGEAIDRKDRDSLPDNAVVITIDDAWFGSYRHMLPTLTGLELPATVYATTYYALEQQPVFDVALNYVLAVGRPAKIAATQFGLADGRHFDTARDDDRDALADVLKESAEQQPETTRQDWLKSLCGAMDVSYDELVRSRQFHLSTLAEIGEMHAAGIDIQLHTHNHNIRESDRENLADEIVLNRAHLAPHVDGIPDQFCYPSGVNAPAMADVLAAAGVKSATLVDAGLVSRDTNNYFLPRILDGEEMHQIEIEAELAGVNEVYRIFKSKFA